MELSSFIFVIFKEVNLQACNEETHHEKVSYILGNGTFQA